jgi:VWFA-related protein
VVINATANDNKGNPVVDLTANDFKIYEDGKPQPIHTFALESYGTAHSLAAAGLKPAAGGTAAPEAAAVQPRLISLVIDDITAPSNEYYYPMTEALRKLVEQDVGSNDQVAILSGSGRVQYLFSHDKRVLLQEIDTLFKKINLSPSSKQTCPTLTDSQAQWIAMNTVKGQTSTQGDAGVELETAIQETILCAHLENVQGRRQIAEDLARSAASMQFQEMEYRNRTLIQTLRQHIRSLKHFEARKMIVLFSAGFLSRELVYELQDVVDQALKVGVVLNTVDIRGLYTGALQASDGQIPVNAVQWKQTLFRQDATAREDPLFQLASDTGGLFYHNSNDLYDGLQKISNRQAFFYVLTYATPSMKADGRYHKITLQVSRPGLNLTYRKGYYAPKEQLTFERRKKEDILEALGAPGNLNEIPINLSYNFFQQDDSRYEVALVTRVDLRRVQFLEEDSRHKNLISLVVVAFDETDRYVDGWERSVDFNLTPFGYSEILNEGLASKVTFQLPAGRFKIKAVVRESVQGKIGSLTKAISIP